MTQFYIVRHGNTFLSGELPTRIGARTDLALTPSGQAQADRLGKHFSDTGIRFMAAFSSPLRRTRETGERILSYQSDPCLLNALDFLTEIDHGPDENRPENEVVARIGEEAIRAWDQAAVPPPGWIVDPESRIQGWTGFFSEQVISRPHAAILLVTSNGAARFALQSDPHLLKARERLQTLKLRTGAYGRIDCCAEAEAEIVAWDLRPALDPN